MQISDLYDRISALPTLENRMVLLQKDIRNAEDEVSALLQRYEQEHRDVEQIKKESFSSFLFKLIGKYEDKLEKEQREEIDAKLVYDRAKTRLEGLVRDKEELASRINALHVEEQTYQAELEHRRKKLARKFMEPEGMRYSELENERNTIISQITEIKEALTAAACVKSTAMDALDALKSAQGWATYDAFTKGGILSHMAKYSHIDSAEKSFHRLSSQLRNLKSELKDIQGLTVSGLSEISSGQRTVDFWFDNIFTDLSVRGRIKDNTEEIKHLLDSINTVESKLKKSMWTEEAKLVDNKRNEEELLLSLR